MVWFQFVGARLCGRTVYSPKTHSTSRENSQTPSCRSPLTMPPATSAASGNSFTKTPNPKFDLNPKTIYKQRDHGRHTTGLTDCESYAVVGESAYSVENNGLDRSTSRNFAQSNLVFLTEHPYPKTPSRSHGFPNLRDLFLKASLTSYHRNVKNKSKGSKPHPNPYKLPEKT